MKEFICPSCNHTESKKEDAITASCDKCGAKMRDMQRLGISENQINSKNTKQIFVCPNCSLEKQKSSQYKKVICHFCEVEMNVKREQLTRDKNPDEADKDNGYVYVLVNSASPDLVKIGMTIREPEKRAEELNSSTGVAMPYIVAYEAQTPHPRRVESAVHDRLSQKRVNPDREFFRVDLKQAVEIIEQEL